jgi:hypothetical protein
MGMEPNCARCWTIPQLNEPELGFTQPGEGREGLTEKDGIGMLPGRRTRRSAQRYPACSCSTKGSSIEEGMGISGTR